MKTGIFVAGACLLLTGAASYITGWALSPYIYAIGAVLVAAIQFVSGYQGNNFTIKRLRRQQIFAAVLLLLTALFMFTTHGNEWIVSLTVAAVLELYSSLRISHEEEKERKKL